MGTFTATVSWDGQDVTGVVEVSTLRASTDVITLHDGGTGATSSIPGRDDVTGVTIQRAVSDDLAFDLWARGRYLRKEVTLTLVDAAATLTVTYRLHGCWVSSYAVVPDLAAGSATEALTLSVRSWERLTPPPAVLAEELARQRGAAVHRIDLGPLTSMDAREAQRRLAGLLADAEDAGAVLLLDEADALFGRRTGVQDAHDRYADDGLEALRQELSRYSGPVVVVPPDLSGAG